MSKKINKAEIYKAYGIEYKGGKINTPLGWLPELLRNGNTKTGAAVKTWAMSTSTCAVQCAKCYGRTGFYAFGNGLEMLKRNATIARDYPEFFRNALFAQLATFKDGTEIRIHVVGDFFSEQYKDTWHNAAEMYPALIFWTYTKTKYESAFDDLDNANIVKSLINGEFNFGHCDHVMKLYNNLTEAGESVHICRCGVDDDQHCAGCHKCSISKYVLFLEHSTEYKAKEDPLFPVLAEMIEAQA